MADLLFKAIQNYLNAYLVRMRFSLKEIKKAQEELSQCYTLHKNTSSLQKKEHFAAYAITRMPATFAAIKESLRHIPSSFSPRSILDVGAGPGTATIAALELWPTLETALLIEQHLTMQDLGREVFKDLQLPCKVTYQSQNVTSLKIEQQFDVVVVGYLLSELSTIDQLAAIRKAWDLTSKVCVIVTPGTPYDYQYLMEIRNFLIERGAFIVAPCPHTLSCPLQNRNDWCHFSARLERSKSHQYAKQGSLNYEDEKFSYLIVSKELLTQASTRLIRPPLYKTGHVIMDLCKTEGVERTVVGKKNKETYKKAIKIQWGDSW